MGAQAKKKAKGFYYKNQAKKDGEQGETTHKCKSNIAYNKL